MLALVPLVVLAPVTQYKPPIQRDFSIDLFLIGGNSKTMDEFNVTDQALKNDPIKAMIAEAVRRQETSKARFLILDGGDCSVSANRGPRQVHYLSCTWTTTTPPTGQNGSRAQTRQTSIASSTASGGINPSGGISDGYVAQAYVYIDEVGSNGGQSVIMQNEVSFRTAKRDKMSQDQVPADQRVILYGGSVEDGIQELAGKTGQFDGVCIGAWGLPNPAYPNFAVFPPAGVVGHYKLFRKDHHLGIRFVEYLGKATGGWSFAHQ